MRDILLPWSFKQATQNLCSQMHTHSSVPLCTLGLREYRVSSTPLAGWLVTEWEAGPVGRFCFKNLLYNLGSFRL